MASEREKVRRAVSGEAAAARPGEPVAAGQRPSGTGAGGGLPENPEARSAEQFGPGGSGGPTAQGGTSGSQYRSPGGEPGRARGHGRKGGDPGTRSANLGERPPGEREETMQHRPSSREGTTNVGREE
jgi:hypothetical protein